MGKIKAFFKKFAPSRRRIIQLYFGLLLNANLKGFLSGKIYNNASGTKFLCAPGINCYSCPGAGLACPLGSLQGAYDNGISTVAYIAGILLLQGILLGRTICGWICPFGLIQDLLHKIPSPKLKKGPITRALSYLKYVVLVIFAIIVPILYALRNIPLPAFCKYICPAGTIEGGLVLLSHELNSSFFAMLGPLFTWKFMLMVSIVVGCVFIYRVFCRFLCPLGAIYGLFNKLCFIGVRVEEDKCIHCNLCVSHCKTDIRHVADRECIHCGECIPVCPTEAICWKGPKIRVRPNEVPVDAQGKKKQEKKKLRIRIVAAAVMLAVLAGAIGYYWVTTPSLSSLLTPSGNTPGRKAPSAALPMLSAAGLTGETIDPTATGKITVVNFWGIWCGPCIEELPYFHQIASDYSEFVAVIAVHTHNQSDGAPAYIAGNYPNSNLIFAVDGPDYGYYQQLGGLGNFPYTVVLDENGIILATFVEKLQYEDLQAVIEDAL